MRIWDIIFAEKLPNLITKKQSRKYHGMAMCTQL